MTASLDNLVRGGQLKRELLVQQELDGLIRSGLARLRDSTRGLKVTLKQ
ncbi:MAG: hypothetical protein ABI779_08405 [Acidobacteriota bacterium]